MAQVSKMRLHPQVERRLYEVFWDSFAGLGSPKEAAKFLEELLTPTEKVMLAKRLAIAILAQKGYTYEQIREVLKVSYATIDKIKRLMDQDGEVLKKFSKDVLRNFEADKSSRELDKTLDKLRRLRKKGSLLHREQPF